MWSASMHESWKLALFPPPGVRELWPLHLLGSASLHGKQQDDRLLLQAEVCTHTIFSPRGSNIFTPSEAWIQVLQPESQRCWKRLNIRPQEWGLRLFCSPASGGGGKDPPTARHPGSLQPLLALARKARRHLLPGTDANTGNCQLAKIK